MTRFQRWLLYASTIAATASGVTYFCLRRFVEPADPWAVVNHPLEPWALKAHVLTAPLMLFAVGMITTQHIWRSLRSSLPTGRRSGVIGAAVFGPLVLSGYLIQTATNELLLEILGWTHLLLGLVCSAAILIHRRMVRGGRRRPAAGSLPVIRSPAARQPAGSGETSGISRAVDAADASPTVAETRGRRSRAHRPRTSLQEESSSAASS